MYIISIVFHVPDALAEKPASWVAPPLDVIVTDDGSRLPQGKGALIIPSFSTENDEPPVLITDGEEVRKALTGRRIVLDPGSYVVLVGSGAPRLSAGVRVEVRQGETTRVPLVWGGLRIEVVDRALKPIGGAYELIEMESGRRINPEEGPAETAPRTWLLAPGLYQIREPGSEGVDHPGYVNVYIPKAGLVHFRLFMTRLGSHIIGGGVIPPEDALARKRDKENAPFSLVFGVDGSVLENRGIPGTQDLLIATGSAYVDADLNVESQRHSFNLRGRLREGATYFSPTTTYFTPDRERAFPLLKSHDELSASALYALKINEGMGFYAQGRAETRMLAGEYVATDQSTLVFQEGDGTLRSESLNRGEKVELAVPWSPTLIKLGAGIRPSLASLQSFHFTLRGGAAYRKYVYGGAYVQNDDPDTPEIEFLALEDQEMTGVEAATSLRVRILGFAKWSTELEAFAPLSDLEQYIVEWDNTLSFRLTQSISLNYTARLERVPHVSQDYLLTHGAFLRVTWSAL